MMMIQADWFCNASGSASDACLRTMRRMHMIATTIQVSPSPVVLLVLLVILGASCAMFWLLARQWTTRRQWLAMLDWAHGNGFAVRENPQQEAPQVLTVLPEEARIDLLVQKEGLSLLRVRTSATPTGQAPQQSGGWHLLLRELEVDWPPTGLRPSAHRASLIDLYRMTSYPSLIPPDRFIVFGTSAPMARALAESSVRALMPADIGLLLHGRHLVLDFSSRPFDPIELERVAALAQQLVSNIPVPTTP
jgi:hypothetical protein